MDDLVSIPAAARLTLTALSRLSRLEPSAGAAAAAAGASAPGPPPLPLALWARAIGSSTDQPSIAEAAGGSASAAVAAAAGGLPTCSAEDVVYMAKSLKRRVLSRMSQAMLQG